MFGKITNFFLIKEIFAGFLLNFYLDSMLTIFFDTIIFVVFLVHPLLLFSELGVQLFFYSAPN